MAVQGVASSSRAPQQGGGVTVDTSQIKTAADRASVLEHLDTLRGDPDVDQSSLLIGQLDTLNVSTALQVSNTDLMIAVTQGRFRQNQSVVASVSAQATGVILALPGAAAGYVGWGALTVAQKLAAIGGTAELLMNLNGTVDLSDHVMKRARVIKPVVKYYQQVGKPKVRVEDGKLQPSP